ncbi:hypothetical protein FB45DRAFT_340025 [Roridomyces roridus]|uniref:MYND-type domain-containing protein n=1 Tax=Roridomyces roridus TaxID=1738132 RepID=A0AAD7FBD4_9AGAR|nr:hypothetical protein FB45DRAFT_340025 [Roridomyces roridus]
MAGRCSGCKAFYYCSKECQIADWRAGHRDFCSSHEHLLLTQLSTDPKLTFTERSFIRTLMSRTYIGVQRGICVHQVRRLASRPADSPPLLFTLFDFCKLPAVVHIRTLVGRPPKVPECIADVVDAFSDEWIDLVSRTKQGRGRMDLHAVRIMNGEVPHVWIIPLRSESADIYEALTALADRVRSGEVEGEEEILEAVDGILAEHQEVMEIH